MMDKQASAIKTHSWQCQNNYHRDSWLVATKHSYQLFDPSTLALPCKAEFTRLINYSHFHYSWPLTCQHLKLEGPDLHASFAAFTVDAYSSNDLSTALPLQRSQSDSWSRPRICLGFFNPAGYVRISVARFPVNFVMHIKGLCPEWSLYLLPEPFWYDLTWIMTLRDFLQMVHISSNPIVSLLLPWLNCEHSV